MPNDSLVGRAKLTAKDREFIECRALVAVLAETPTEKWPSKEFLLRKAKEIMHVA